MAYNASVYKGNNLLGTGSITTNSITSFTAAGGNVVGSGRNVSVTGTSGNNIGATFNTRVLTDGGTTLTLKDATPFS